MLFMQNCKDDPCLSLICLNGGTCDSELGICVCLAGYTGTTCELQVLPVSIKVTDVTVIAFPPQNFGDTWDPQGGGADIYFKIMQGKTEVYRYHKTVDDVEMGKIYQMKPLTPVIIDPAKTYVLELWDSDADESKNDQKMDAITFVPYHGKNKFPAEVEVNEYKGIAFKVKLEYVR